MIKKTEETTQRLKFVIEGEYELDEHHTLLEACESIKETVENMQGYAAVTTARIEFPAEVKILKII